MLRSRRSAPWSLLPLVVAIAAIITPCEQREHFHLPWAASPHWGQRDYTMSVYTVSIHVSHMCFGIRCLFSSPQNGLVENLFSLKTGTLPTELPVSSPLSRAVHLLVACCLVISRQGKIPLNSFRNAAHPGCKTAGSTVHLRPRFVASSASDHQWGHGVSESGYLKKVWSLSTNHWNLWRKRFLLNAFLRIHVATINLRQLNSHTSVFSGSTQE